MDGNVEFLIIFIKFNLKTLTNKSRNRIAGKNLKEIKRLIKLNGYNKFGPKAYFLFMGI